MSALVTLGTITGGQERTVLDTRQRPLRDIRISLTDHCNLRCTYCMPTHTVGDKYPFLSPDRLLTFEEITSVVQILAGLGVRKVKLTGGEPLTRPFLPRLIQMIRAAAPDMEVALITNGVLLAPLADRLREAGLARVTVSLDSLDAERFAAISGRRNQLPAVLDGIEAARRAGFGPIKINVVVIRGVNDSEVEQIAERFRHPDFIVRFIEYMDVGTANRWQAKDVVTASEILARLRRRHSLVPLEPAYSGETARRYAYADGSGEIGFIASISQPFCGDCSRLRLSADGKLYTCLFAKDGLDMKTVLRTRGNNEARDAIVSLWRGRRDQYSVDRGNRSSVDKIEMFYIGG